MGVALQVAVAQFDGQTVLRGLPLAAGLLASAIGRAAGLAEVQCTIHTARVGLDAAVDALGTPDLIALSGSTWNLRYSLAVAAHARARGLTVPIVLGGPSVPRDADEAARMLHEQPAIDALALGEGEGTFVELVEALREGRPLAEVPGLVLRVHGSIAFTPPRPRLRDLTVLGSPYLDGTFDSLWPELRDDVTMAAVETNRGCPFSCSFCDWGQATGSAVHELPLERVRDELRWVGEHEIPIVYFIDANFGIRPRDEAVVDALCEVHARTGFPTTCVFHLTKNARRKNLRTVERLHEAGVACRMSLSMQDFDADVLAAIDRENIPPARAVELRALCHARGIPTFNELILGLPLQTYSGFCRSVAMAVTPYPDDRFAHYLCRLLPNTALASPDHRERFGLRTVHCRSLPADPSLDPVVEETEEIVVGTDALPHADWRRAWAFGHLVALCSQHGVMDVEYRAAVFDEGEDPVAWFDRVVRACLEATTPALAPLGEVIVRYIDSIADGGPLLLPGPGGRRLPLGDALAIAASANRDGVRAAVLALRRP